MDLNRTIFYWRTFMFLWRGVIVVLIKPFNKLNQSLKSLRNHINSIKIINTIREICLAELY